MLIKNKKGVFGLTAVQSFFAIILGVALLAYIIVIIMGVLGGTTILQYDSGGAANESVSRAAIIAGTTLGAASYPGGICGAITIAYNGTAAPGTIAAGNFTQTGCTITNSTAIPTYTATNILINYPYTRNSLGQNNLNTILSNTSSGITGFFSAINPIYAILAVLVIILVLVVLVRVVQSPGSSSREQL